MAELQKQTLDIKLLGLDEKANPREAIPGTLTTLENCVMYKDGRIQKRAGLSALSMVDNVGTTITNAREITSYNGQLLLNDGNRWYQRHPVTGAWTRKGYSAYERLDIAPLCSTAAECNGQESRLEMDSATIGRYGLVMLCGTDSTTGMRESGWYLYDKTTGALLLRRQLLYIQDASVCTDGASTESFVIFGVVPAHPSATSCTINAYVISATDGYTTVAASGAVVSDVSWSPEHLHFNDPAPPRKMACFEVLRTSANTWLLAYHQYSSDGGDHSVLVIRTITRTSGATFTVSSAATVDTFADQDAGPISWAYRSGAYAHLAWDHPGDEIYSAQVTIADRTVGTPSACGFGFWTSCLGITGDVIGTQPYFVIDYLNTENEPHDRYLYLWQVGVDYSLLLRDAGLLTKAFQVENQLSNEFGIGVFVPSEWQPSAFLLRVRVDGHDAIGTTVGAHLSAGDFAGRPITIKVPSANGGAFVPIGKLVNPDSLGGSGVVGVSVASVRNPLVVSATPTTTAYATQGQPIEVAGTAILPGAALKQYDGETVGEAAFYLGPDWVSPSAITATEHAAMEIGTRLYTAVARWTDARGRMQRSAPCPAVSVTTSSHYDISVSHPWLHLTERCNEFNYNQGVPDVVIEFYRTPVDSTTFYLVGTATNTPNATYGSFTDDTPDSEITDNEQLYTTGESVQNWPVIGCNDVKLHQGRLFVLTSAGDVYFTGYLQDGEALTFAEEYELDTEHIPGTITAILSMDDKFLVCTDAIIASTMGLGPESNGLPPYDSPMVISSTLGPLGPRACVRIPDGIVMPTRHGIYLLDRGLSFQDIGPAVDTSAYGLIPGYAGAFHQTYKQIRIFGSGSTKTALAWDTGLIPPPNRSGQWMKWTHSVDVVATATCSGSLYYLGHNGTVYLSDSGTSDAGTAYQQALQFTVLSPAGVNGWARIYKMRAAVDLAAGCVLKAYLNPEEGNLSAAETWTYTAATAKQHVDLKPRRGKVSSLTCWIGENAASTNAGFVLDALTLLVGNKGGLGRLPAASRMTRSA